MNREKILKQYVDSIKRPYDYVLIDCMPSLGMLTINALAAADSVMIPVQAQYLPAKGLEQLLRTVRKVKKQINPRLKIDGILLTMVDHRTNYAKEISALIRETYADQDQGVRDRHTAFRARRRNQRRGKEHLRLRSQGKGGGSLSRIDEGGVAHWPAKRES